MGRSAEIDELDRLLTAALGGGSGRVLVVGDPGVGKTALLDALCAECGCRDATALRLAAAPGDRALPFALLDEWGRRFPTLAAAGAADARTRGTLLRARLEAAANEHLVVILDELQYADLESVAALGGALARCDDQPLVALLAGRDDPAVDQLLEGWPRLVLGPLGLDDSVALLESILGPDAEPSVVYQLAGALDGNPLALTEVPRLLTDDERSGRRPLPTPLPVPDVLEHAWLARVEGLPPTVRAAAIDLAVAGSRPALLAGMARDGGWTMDDLALLEDLGLMSVAADGTPQFAHRVVR